MQGSSINNVTPQTGRGLMILCWQFMRLFKIVCQKVIVNQVWVMSFMDNLLSDSIHDVNYFNLIQTFKRGIFSIERPKLC